MSNSWSANNLCRNESCDRIELHRKHRVISKQPKKESSRSTIAEPWRRSAPLALSESITKATPSTHALPYEVLLREVENDYGECCSRTVQRHLRTLVERGHVLRIDLGRRLYGYLRPGSNMVNDLDLLREQVLMQTTVMSEA
jgi:hypothetical protein